MSTHLFRPRARRASCGGHFSPFGKFRKWGYDSLAPAAAIENVDTALHDFDSKLDYAARFAKYIPYLIMRPGFMEDAVCAARTAFGFSGDIFAMYNPPEFLDDDVMSYNVDAEFSDGYYEGEDIRIDLPK